MSKQIITAETVRMAWQSGQSSIALGPGDIVTQQARDDARQHGITWKDTSATPAPASVPGAVPADTQPVAVTENTAAPAPQTRAGLSPEQMVAAVTAQLQQALAPLARALAVPQGYAPGVAPASVLAAPISYTPGMNPMAVSAAPLTTPSMSEQVASVTSALVASATSAPTPPPAPVYTPAPVAQGFAISQATPTYAPAPVAQGFAISQATPTYAPAPVAQGFATSQAAPTYAPAPARAEANSVELATLTAEVRNRVLAALPAGVTADNTLMDQLIRKALSDNPCTVCACDACSSKGGSPVSETSTPPTGKLPGLEQVGGVMHVSSRAQAWGNGSARDSVSMMDVLSPSKGAAAAVGYLEWESLSFSWTFERPEVLVVLEGELKLTIEGTTLFGAAGDVFSIPKGVEIALASTGHVKCTTVGSVAA